ncbi:MnhA multisubunit Na+/H+ antiporter, MnhA subunit [Desulfosarcina variabilis str. Montpellier]|uniref:NADH-quinone oxidoreductase subunit 5 family protein n=1 Tax=Desulfosarcina variabilis TaxID=2300 RepID=UPI003AFA5C56
MNPNLFRFDSLSMLVGVSAGLFFLLILLYSSGYMRGRKGLVRYYLYTVLTFVASLGVIFANNVILFLVFWGFLGLLLCLLIAVGRKDRAAETARKTLIIVGGADAFMLLGVAMVWRLAEVATPWDLTMDSTRIALTGGKAVAAYLCLAAGALAKAGAMPFHTWVPDTAEDAPVPVTAYLPASLDKLLGIYFLARISLEMFQMSTTMNTVLMGVGSFTIIAAVMMALVQHDLKRLLGYHAVSQVGYMVLGIGTGNPIGIAGGLFHMLNNAIYKSCLFLAGGVVEKSAGTSDLDRLGGLAGVMPITFGPFLIASLAISGVPPFNGFASKWLIYQGIIEVGKNGDVLWILWLSAAMFGSALTLASFMKLVHAVFLGQPSPARKRKENGAWKTGPTLWIPPVILGILCVAFGVFAAALPLRFFIYPSVPGEIVPAGIWGSGWAAIMILIGLGIGLAIYLLGTLRKTRTVEAFVGGEILEEHPEMRVSGVDFYQTIQNLGILKLIYDAADRKFFDIYEVGRKTVLGCSRLAGSLHNGLLPRYIVWYLLGMAILFYVLMG